MIALPSLATLKLAGGAVVIGALVATGTYWKGRLDGEAIAEVAPLKSALNDIRERNIDDAATQRLSDYDLCVRDLGGLPECDRFR